MLTNFKLKQLKPKLDIVKKPENRVHELTDSNVSRMGRRGEYSCRCHGKRVISAPSKPLKPKLARHILWGETRLRTEGFCSAPLRSCDIRDEV